ncbi:MAG: thermonuclease family protein, partial [Microthrixaceae bacterium]
MSRPGRLAIAGVAVLAVAMLLGCGGSGAPGSAEDAVQANAVVERVVDGDTLVVVVDGAEERVRLIGMNTPESVDRRRPVMCFGKEASAHLDELVPAGTPVRLERDVEVRDRYDRLLAYLYRASDGLFVNLAMVTDGYAQQYTFPPNV